MKGMAIQMKQCTIHSETGTPVIGFEGNPLLSQLLEQAGERLSMPCGGNHTCGKCRVRAAGAISPPEEAERALLGDAVTEGVRLACFAKALGDCEIFTDARYERTEIMTAGTEIRAAYDGGDGPALGFAVDIGTTTVVSYLYDLPGGKLLETVCEMNRQYTYGSDVISRIDASNQSGPGPQQRSIVTQLEGMFARSLQQAQAEPELVKRVVITGNTTMLHFLTGKDPRGIGVSPFVPESLFGMEIEAGEVFGMFLLGTKLVLPACISAYVGADITCGIVSTGMTERRDAALLVDVGTNGEMALYREGELVCCATAAGPAFEGAEIAMGMTATAGAINRVFLEDGQVRYCTIGDEKPAGICGTGMISCVSLMLRLEVLDETGAILEEGHGYEPLITEREGQPAFAIGDSGVVITQQDIRNIQLAKAAIAAGIDAMLHDLGTEAEQVGVLYLCGGFGSYIDPAEAAGMGLIPAALADRVKAAGNTAGSGAVEILFSHKRGEEAKALAGKAKEISLSASPYFMERYIERMMFES